jgi:hypothetical protein
VDFFFNTKGFWWRFFYSSFLNIWSTLAGFPFFNLRNFFFIHFFKNVYFFPQTFLVFYKDFSYVFFNFFFRFMGFFNFFYLHCIDFLKHYFLINLTQIDLKTFYSFFDLDKILKYLGTIKYDNYISLNIFFAPLIWIYNNNVLVGPKAIPLFKKRVVAMPRRNFSRFLKFFGDPMMFIFTKPKNTPSIWFGDFFYNKKLDFMLNDFLHFTFFLYRIFTFRYDWVSLFPDDFFVLFFKWNKFYNKDSPFIYPADLFFLNWSGFVSLRHWKDWSYSWNFFFKPFVFNFDFKNSFNKFFIKFFSIFYDSLFSILKKTSFCFSFFDFFFSSDFFIDLNLFFVEFSSIFLSKYFILKTDNIIEEPFLYKKNFYLAPFLNNYKLFCLNGNLNEFENNLGSLSLFLNYKNLNSKMDSNFAKDRLNSFFYETSLFPKNVKGFFIKYNKLFNKVLSFQHHISLKNNFFVSQDLKDFIIKHVSFIYRNPFFPDIVVLFLVIHL